MHFPHPVSGHHITISRPNVKPTNPRCKVANAVAEIGFTRLGQQEPYFHVLAGVDNKLGNGRWESTYGRFAACADHDTFRREFKEEAVQKLPRWHLCGIYTGPMHYEANAIYWAEKFQKAKEAIGQEIGAASEAAAALTSFKHTVVWGALVGEETDANGQDEIARDAARLGVDTEGLYPWTYGQEKLREWLRLRLPALMAEFQHDVQNAFPGMWMAAERLMPRPEGAVIPKAPAQEPRREPPGTLATEPNKSWAPEVIADGSGTWCGNNLRFATKEEAEANVRDLSWRWMLVRETRVVESTDVPNYAWDVDIGLVALRPGERR